MKHAVFRIGKFHNREKFNLWLGLCKCKLKEIKVHEARTLQFLVHATRTVYGEFLVHNVVKLGFRDQC